MEKELLALAAAFVGGSAFKTLVDFLMNRLRDDPHNLLFKTLLEANQKYAERIAVLERENTELRRDFDEKYDDLLSKYMELKEASDNPKFSGI